LSDVILEPPPEFREVDQPTTDNTRSHTAHRRRLRRKKRQAVLSEAHSTTSGCDSDSDADQRPAAKLDCRLLEQKYDHPPACQPVGCTVTAMSSTAALTPDVVDTKVVVKTIDAKGYGRTTASEAAASSSDSGVATDAVEVVSTKTCFSGTGTCTEVMVRLARAAEEAPMGPTPTPAVVIDHRPEVMDVKRTEQRK